MSPGKHPEATLLPLTVLVADPSPHMAGLVAGMLRAIKVREVREVHSAAAALSELGRRDYSALVLDDGMKDIDSVEFVRQLRASATSPSRSIPIIMMSTAPGLAEIKAARDAGVTEFLRKPFAPRDIGARLNTILNAPRDFIAGSAYAGPDRRRRTAARTGEERRAPDEPMTDPTAG